MSKLFMYGGAAVVIGGMALAGGQMMEEDRAEAVAKFQITETERPMMDACEQAMSYQDVEFVSGVENIAGCGCITREIHDRVQANEAGLARDMLTPLMEGVKSNRDENTVAAIEALVKKHNVTETRARAVFAATLDAVDKCSDHDVYMTKEQKLQIADDKAKKKASSRKAFDELVKDGRMTREEADRRLARM